MLYVTVIDPHVLADIGTKCEFLFAKHEQKIENMYLLYLLPHQKIIIIIIHDDF